MELTDNTWTASAIRTGPAERTSSSKLEAGSWKLRGFTNCTHRLSVSCWPRTPQRAALHFLSRCLVPRFVRVQREESPEEFFFFPFFVCFCFKTRCAAQRPPPESLEKCGAVLDCAALRLSLASHVTAPTTLTARLFPAARLGHLRVRMRCVRKSPRVDERAQRRVFRIRHAKKQQNSASKSVHRMLNKTFKKKTFISYRSRWRYLLLF